MIVNQIDGTIPSQICNYFAGQIRLLDDYYLVRTADNQYVGNIVKPTGKEYTYVFNRDGNAYSVNITDEQSTINISNPLYAYSSVGTLGIRLDTPCVYNMSSFAVCFIACVLALWICFKGVLFKCFGVKKVK